MHIHSARSWHPQSTDATQGASSTSKSSAASGGAGFDVAAASSSSATPAAASDPISSLLSTLGTSVQNVLTNLQEAGSNTGATTGVASPQASNNGAASLSAMLQSYQAAGASAASVLGANPTSLTV